MSGRAGNGGGADDTFAPDRLQLPPEEMRRLGYRVVDLLVEHFSRLDGAPVGRRGSRAELEARLREPLQEEPGRPDELLERLEREVFGSMLHVDHPRFFAFVPGPGNFVSAMADALAAGLNVFTGTWFAGSGPAQVELVVVDWLRQLCGLPEGAGGLFVSGGSMANLTALAVARHVRLGDRTGGAVVYTSDQTHSSVFRALRVLGFAPEQVRTLPSDGEFRLPPAELRRAMEADRAAGRTPFCVVANAGTTNTGAVDPLGELAELCRAEGVWLHADGAYGVPAVLTGPGRRLLDGLGGVDSLSLDPHKWLFQSFETGCVLVRDRHLLRRTFQILPEYLRDTHGAQEEVNFGDYGIQLTRSFRALKLWMSLQVFGLRAFREAIGRGIRLAELAEGILREGPRWEVVTPAQLAVVTFRYVPPGATPEATDELNGRMVGEMLADGFALATSTVLRGRTVLRLCTINPRTTEPDIRETLRRLEAIGERLCLQ
ncbi:MAG TPA: aminotransferase class V-fold PLP-dependent enzyme [Longimicrobiaceae bacterium]|nr:aminotransferase class V-fold PLP-dependent enzyme [Longimicrobiaceae bacterium]